jgi:hypothetical protein
MSGNVKCNTEKSNLKPPDYCTSICCRGNDSYCKDCSHALWYGSATVNGKLWHWEFNPRFGPVFLTKDGSVKKRQSSEKHPVWKEFEKWVKET